MIPMNKIVELNSIPNLLQKKREKKEIIVTTNGAFDLFHYGHLKSLEYAKSLGDILIVLVNSDYSIKKYKDERRPIISQDERIRIIASISCVDYVILFEDKDPRNILEIIKPNFHVKGSEYQDDIIEKEIVEKNDGKIIFFNRDSNDVSTSGIIKKILKIYGE